MMVKVADYAEMRGISRQSVYKAAKRHGVEVIDGELDAEALDAARKRGKDPARQMVKDQQQAEAAAKGQSPESESDSATAGFAQARLRREVAQAELAEYKLKEARGELIHARQVEEALVSAGRRIRERLDRLPALSEELIAVARTGDVAQVRSFLRAQVRKLEDAIIANLSLTGDEDSENA